MKMVDDGSANITLIVVFIAGEVGLILGVEFLCMLLQSSILW